MNKVHFGASKTAISNFLSTRPTQMFTIKEIQAGVGDQTIQDKLETALNTVLMAGKSEGEKIKILDAERGNLPAGIPKDSKLFQWNA